MDQGRSLRAESLMQDMEMDRLGSWACRTV